LRPILDEFVLAARGKPTPDFWSAIYKPEEDAYATAINTSGPDGEQVNEVHASDCSVSSTLYSLLGFVVPQ